MSALLPDGIRVRWLGHSAFEIFGHAGQKFLFDPFLRNNPKFPQELEAEIFQPGAFQAILVTHPHFDHFEDLLPLLQGDSALKVITQYDIGEWLRVRGVKEEQILGMNIGGTANVEGVRITMVSATHTSSVIEDGALVAIGSPVGFVLRFANGFTIYNTGDTGATMDMHIVRDLYKPDLVILPIGDFFTMGAEQAAYALNILQPRFALGAHWQTWVGRPPGTPEELEKELERYQVKTQVIKLPPGGFFT